MLRLSTNRRNVTFDATFVTDSIPVWTCLSLRMGVVAAANALPLLLQSLKFILETQRFVVSILLIKHLI